MRENNDGKNNDESLLLGFLRDAVNSDSSKNLKRRRSIAGTGSTYSIDVLKKLPREALDHQRFAGKTTKAEPAAPKHDTILYKA